MCLIIHNPDGLDVDPDIIYTALIHNPDGFGIFYHDTGEIKRTMSSEAPFKWMAQGRPYTAHFRYSTSGKVGKKQCHPFKINDRFALMQNGTVEHLRSATEVDTARLAKVLSGIPQEHWQAVLETHPCRFAVCDRDTGAVQIANRSMWTEYEGCLYSKPDVLEDYAEMLNPAPGTRYPATWGRKTTSTRPSDVWDPLVEDDLDDAWERSMMLDDDEPVFGASKTNTVAVYGTLKQGHANHERHLGEAIYVGSGVTAARYPLVVSGLPYLLDKKGTGHHVEVEVYEVSDAELARLDGLEGHPQWYRRSTVPIKLDNGNTRYAWVYLMPDMSYDSGIYQESY
jgi:gamma-glutamylaminecyclotransferase